MSPSLEVSQELERESSEVTGTSLQDDMCGGDSMAVDGSVMTVKITVSRHWASVDGLALSILYSHGMSPLYQSSLGDGYIDCPASPLPAKILIQQAWGRHPRTAFACVPG